MEDQGRAHQSEITQEETERCPSERYERHGNTEFVLILILWVRIIHRAQEFPDHVRCGCRAAMLPVGTRAMAGPFFQGGCVKSPGAGRQKVAAEWLASLTQRGQAEVFSGEQLKYVGMPVGGIGCGQLYLGGDGQLWLWDIFKCNYGRERDHGKRIAAFTLGGHYAHPVAAEAQSTRNGTAPDVAQGFLILRQDIRQDNDQNARSTGLPRRDLPRGIPDRQGDLRREGISRCGKAGGIQSVYSTQHQRLSSACDGDELHRHEHVRRSRGCRSRELDAEHDLPVYDGFRSRGAKEPCVKTEGRVSMLSSVEG